MSELREAAQAALEHWDKVSGIFRMTTETNRLRAALAQPETTAEPVAWAVMCDGANCTQICLTETAANLIAENLREQNRGRDFDWQTIPLYAHPPRDIEPPTEETKS